MHPRNITVEADGTVLQIEWADHRISRIRGDHLRQQCDCTSCLSERSGSGISLRTGNSAASLIRRVDLPSSSRLSVVFEDGHDRSFFRFADLLASFPPTDTSSGENC